MTPTGGELVPVLLAFMGWGDRPSPVRVTVDCEPGHELGAPRVTLHPGPGSRPRLRS